jgi:hypothetical protein
MAYSPLVRSAAGQSDHFSILPSWRRPGNAAGRRNLPLQSGTGASNTSRISSGGEINAHAAPLWSLSAERNEAAPGEPGFPGGTACDSIGFTTIDSQAAMKCPYCAEEIKDDAVVCKHCQRDFFIILPLLKTLNDMGKRIEALESEIANVPLLEKARAAPLPAAKIVEHAAVGRIVKSIPGLAPLSAVALCIIALVVAHFFIVVQYDLRLAYLRMALFALPLLFGLLFREDGERHLLWDIAAGLSVAVLSTLAMLVIVSKIDDVPILPDNAQEWRELGYYVASIAFGFFTGALVRQIVGATVSPTMPRSKIIGRTSRYIAARMAGSEPTALEKNLKRAQTVVSAVMALGSAILSVASGLGITGGH